MPIQWIERLDSREVEQLRDTAQAFRRFLAWTDDRTPLDESEVFAAIGITTGDPYPGLAILHAQDFRIFASSQREYAFEAEVRYVLAEIGPLDDGSSVSASFTVEWMDAWRGFHDGTGLDMAGDPVSGNEPEVLKYRSRIPPGDTTNDPMLQFPDRASEDQAGVGADISGEPIDSAGEPVSVQVVKGGIDITQRRTGNTSIFLLSQFLAGKRNAFPFLGAEAGRLLYTGFTATQEGTGFAVAQGQINLDERIDIIEHHFAWDAFYHLRQQPAINERTKKPIVGDDFRNTYPNITGYNQIYNKFAYPVHFVQPYVHLADFSILGFS